MKCIYAYVFETPVDVNDAFLRNRGMAAHPYIIRPPLNERRVYRSSDKLSFELIFIGRAADYLPYFAQAFIMMGNLGLGRGKGKFILVGIDGRDAHGQTRMYYQPGDEHLRASVDPLTCSDILRSNKVPNRRTLRFITRLDLKEKGEYGTITFGVVFRSLLRRIVTLAHLHNGIDCRNIDFGGLSHLAENIKTISSHFYREDAERFSNRQMQRMPFGGRLGEIAFEGDLTPFWPFLVLGEHVHVGKKTSFGFGQYELCQVFY